MKTFCLLTSLYRDKLTVQLILICVDFCEFMWNCAPQTLSIVSSHLCLLAVQNENANSMVVKKCVDFPRFSLNLDSHFWRFLNTTKTTVTSSTLFGSLKKDLKSPEGLNSNVSKSTWTFGYQLVKSKKFNKIDGKRCVASDKSLIDRKWGVRKLKT